MRRKILVVDDIATNRIVLKQIFDSEYEVLEAENGKEACAILQRKYKMISAVILDIVMPMMDGYEVLESMKSNPVLSQLPVIVMTGNNDKNSEAKALAAGANDFIYKQCDPSTIRYRIRNLIKLRESASIVNVMQRDDLTGLYNRKGFFDKARDLIKMHAAGSYVMACFDIDNFKIINDQYGSDKGDDVLRYIASVFSDGFGIVGGICGRITADIFSVMYPKSFMDSDEIIEIRKKASYYAEAKIHLSFSIGRYIIDDLSLSVSAMYDRASIAEDSVKGRYDTHTAMYDESMRTHLLREQEIISEMNLALKNKQFEVWFQPQFNHSSSELIGSEALVRWHHPSNGIVMPGEFISVFERNGFIYELDKYVWEQCCIHLRKQLDKGKAVLPVSVNISRYDIFRNDFIDIITGLIKKYELSVDLLRLEITESAFAKSSEQIISVVRQLIDFGFIVEIDDFGSGYSSLNTLKDVPAQVLKLDMKFLESSNDTKRGGNILESITYMAKRIGMTVIAEGVETKEQADYLNSIGCNYVQGYLYGKPMKWEDYFVLSSTAGAVGKMIVNTDKNYDGNSEPSSPSLANTSANINKNGEASATSPFTLNSVMEFSTDITFAKDCDSNYICCSKAFAKMAGYEKESDVVGKNDHELFPKETADRFRKDDVQLLNGGETSVDFVESIPTNNGVVHYTRLTKHLLKDSQGTVVGIYGVGRNISEYKTAFEYLRLLTDKAPGGLAMFECSQADIRSLYYNRAFYEFSGYTKEEYEKLSAQNPMCLIFNEDLPKVYAAIAELECGKSQLADCIYRCRVKSGGFRWFGMKSTVSTRLRNSVIINTVQFDITEKIAAEDKLRISEEQFHIAAGKDGRFVSRYDVVNDIFHDESGLFSSHGLGRDIRNTPQALIDAGIVKHGSIENLRDFFSRIVKGEQDCSTDLVMSTIEGDNLWYRVNSTVVFDADREPAQAIILLHNITDQHEKEAVYRKWQQSLTERDHDAYTLIRCNLSKNTSFDSIEGNLLNIDIESKQATFDEYIKRYTGTLVYTDDCDNFAAALNSDTLLANYYRGIKTTSVEYREIMSESKYRWLLLTVDLVEYPNSSDIEAYLMYENIDEQKKAQLHTKELSETDPLTGVLNRKTFVSRLEKIILQSPPGTKHALLMLDLDGFKMINDSFGHAAGDQTLIEISQTLRSVLRHGDLLGRLGGDEFVICLKDVPDDKIAKKKAVQIGVLARKSFRYDVQISASIGIALYPRDGSDFDTLYHNVDTALYHVKDSGKDSYAFYSEKMRDGHFILDNPDEIVSFSNPTPKRIKRRILIVDDSKLDLEMLVNMFDDDFQIEKAKDGHTALTLLRHYGTAISVVLLDLYMPGMDGFAVLEKMRKTRSMKSIPVVVVSGADDREISLKAIRSGATDFITKPIDPDLIKLRVYAAISKSENERLRAQNSFLMQQDDEIAKYRIAFERTGTVMIEYDWIGGVFYYDQSVSLHILGKYNSRTLWEILLADLVADTSQVQEMQEFIHALAMDRTRMNGSLDVYLKTPQRVTHKFHMNVFKRVNDFQLTNRLLLTFNDTQAQKSDMT